MRGNSAAAGHFRFAHLVFAKIPGLKFNLVLEFGVNTAKTLNSSVRTRVWSNFSDGRKVGRKKLQPTNYFCTFDSFELKLCRMVELVFQKILVCFLFFDFNCFWRENDVTRLTAKLKFQDMAKQINNLKKARRDRVIECVKCFSKFQLGKELLSFDYRIFRHFVTIF